MNRKNDLREALQSVFKQSFTDFEVIVVDNASSDGTDSMIREEFPNVRYIRSDKNIAAGAFVLGAKEANGDIIFNLDDDAILQGDNLNVIYEAFKNDNQLGALSAQIIDYESKEVFDPWKWFSDDEHKSDDIYPITFISGCGASFRKSALVDVGYISESVFFYGWEMDISAKLIDAGYKVMYAPEFKVMHKTSKVARNEAKNVFNMTTNGFWYYIRFFPLGIILREIPKNLLYYGAIAIKKRVFLSYLHALFSTVIGLPKVLKDRKPIKKENIARVIGEYDVWKLTKMKIKEAIK
jgi:GT2 family glycosyltransferase